MYIKNKNELKRRIDLFLNVFTPEEYKINYEFCKETMRMMEEFICCVNNRLDSANPKIIAEKRKRMDQVSFIPMTLDEAIAHAREGAKKLERKGNNSCAASHWQLAGWLEELKELKSSKN